MAGAESFSLDQLPASFLDQLRNGEVAIDVTDERVQAFVYNEKLAAFEFTRGGVDAVLVAYTVLPGSQWDVGWADPVAQSGYVFVEAPQIHFPGAAEEFTLYFDKLVPGIPQWTFWSNLPQTTVIMQDEAILSGGGDYELSGDPDYIQSGTMTFPSGHEPFICIECSFFLQFNLLYLDYSGVALQFNLDEPRLMLLTGRDSYDTTPYGWGLDILASVENAIDSDSDGVSDVVDNCLFEANISQIDSDGDGFGNHCDADFNNDCQINFSDLQAMKAFFFTSFPPFDLNGDGEVNFIDLARMSEMFFLAPGPAATPNLCAET